MRSKLFLLTLLIIAGTATLRATDLRGRVDGINPYNGMLGPMPGMPVGLFVAQPDGSFTIVRQATTGMDGMYYLRGVHPGYYVLQIGGVNYPLFVANAPWQDIPIIRR